MSTQIKFEAPKDSGLSETVDIELIIANAVSRLLVIRPELKNELHRAQRRQQFEQLRDDQNFNIKFQELVLLQVGETIYNQIVCDTIDCLNKQQKVILPKSQTKVESADDWWARRLKSK